MNDGCSVRDVRMSQLCFEVRIFHHVPFLGPRVLAQSTQVMVGLKAVIITHCDHTAGFRSHECLSFIISC